MRDAIDRLLKDWVYGGFLAGLLLLLMTPVLTQNWSSQKLLAFLVLPIYMLHQFEEHNGDRFRLFINETIGHGLPVLSHLAVFIINIGGVWLVLAASFFAMQFVSPGWGIVGIYLISINATAHIVQAVALRRYNPGLITAIILFVPLAAYYSWSQDQISMFQNIVGFLTAFLIHAGIMIFTRRRYLALSKAT